jgi:hypothetical protein
MSTTPKFRKNIEVLTFIEYANKQLARTDLTANYSFKCAICVIVEELLFKTKNYKGFMFNNSDSTEIGDKDFYSRTYYINSKLLK